jgi:hypothetical protein
MSRAPTAQKTYTEFAARFIEVCGTEQPVKVKRLLNVSYQSAKNYLGGRIPDWRVLMTIADRTPYSIHWLLTGKGGKFVETVSHEDTPLLSREVEASVRRICVEVINEINVRQETSQPKVVVLRSGEFLSEKVMDESTAVSEKQP